MKRHLFAFFFLSSFFLTAQTQDCDCESNFKWLKTTFEKNDAGFAYALEQKGASAYKAHNTKISEQVKSITNISDCNTTLNAWLRFFRSGHVSLRPVVQNNSGTTNSNVSNESVIAQFKNWEKLDVDLPKFTKYLQSKENIDFEGIWVSGVYTIGIKKIDDAFVGFIVEADGVYWTKDQVKLKIAADKSATFYMRDHSAVNFDKATLLSDNYLQMGHINLKRKVPELKTNPAVERYFKIIEAEQPYFEKIDDQTTFLRIPSFSGSRKPIIDSVIHANKELILKTPNLIIDIRNNGGGSDRSYHELLPIMYTNPIRTVGMEMYSTELNNQRMLDFINKPEYGFSDDEKKWAQSSYDTLSKHLGEFVNLNEGVVSITKYDEVHEFPKNIAILINEANGSTAEQFLLAAKQSKKVKLFGTTTYGVLDISNMYFVKSPSEEFELGYCLSKSMRIPEMTIDDKGIQPDYYIDKGIPKYEWIKFTMDVLKETSQE